MELNKFIWNNYKESKEGQKVIKLFEKKNFPSILDIVFKEKRNNKDYNYFKNSILELNEVIMDYENEVGNDAYEKMFMLLLEYGFPIVENGEILFEKYPDQEMEIIYRIEILSSWLFNSYPDVFLPYYFQNNLQQLTKIADTFNIELPLIPLRKEKLKRISYYYDFCKILLNYGKINNLNSSELCAFLYDFAPKYNGNESVEYLPEPSNIWLCGGAKDDYPYLLKAENSSKYIWQGNEDTRKGDIIVMYCLSPQSNIEFVCRAINDGIRDPFFHYYGSINLGQIQHVKPIHISEIKSDEYLKNLPIVRKNFQGVNGTRINNEDYKRILHLLEEKGEDISKLPKLSSVDFKPNDFCKNEREVEISIVEPFLLNLNYSEDDWVRQLSVRMGRGERNYPDYVFFAETKKGYEKGKMLLETKFFIKNNKELEDTFQQAHSYALRLKSEKLVICDKDIIMIYERHNDSFDRTKYLKFNWQ